MNRLKLPIIILLVLVAGGAGLYVSGIVGGSKDAGVKSPVRPVVLVGNDPTGFTLNLADTDKISYVVFNVALEPAPMTKEDHDLWTGAGGGGHGGGGGEEPGPTALSTYPKFRDAVIDVASQFTSEQLLAKGGQDKLKQALLHEFEVIYERDKSLYSASTKQAGHHDPTHPPYHISDVYIQNFAVQMSQ